MAWEPPSKDEALHCYNEALDYTSFVRELKQSTISRDLLGNGVSKNEQTVLSRCASPRVVKGMKVTLSMPAAFTTGEKQLII